MASPPTAGWRTRSRSALSKGSTTRSGSSSGAPTACATRTIYGSKFSPACCPSYSGGTSIHRPDGGEQAGLLDQPDPRMSVHSLTVHMMDNASALPTCAQQQQQLKLLLIIIDQKLPTRLRDEAFFIAGKADGLEQLYPPADQLRPFVPGLVGRLDLDNVGHWVQHEASAEVSDQLVKFLRIVKPG